MKILRCVCFKCSKLLVSKERFKHVLDIMLKTDGSLSLTSAKRLTVVVTKHIVDVDVSNPKIKCCYLVAEWAAIDGLDSEQKDSLTTLHQKSA